MVVNGGLLFSPVPHDHRSSESYTTMVHGNPFDVARSLLVNRQRSRKWSSNGITAVQERSMGWFPIPTRSPLWRALLKVCSTELFAPQRLDAQQQALRRDKVQRSCRTWPGWRAKERPSTSAAWHDSPTSDLVHLGRRRLGEWRYTER